MVHLTGDLVLAEIAGLLKNCIRGSDAIIRYGGDEFLILLADTTALGAEGNSTNHKAPEGMELSETGRQIHSEP